MSGGGLSVAVRALPGGAVGVTAEDGARGALTVIEFESGSLTVTARRRILAAAARLGLTVRHAPDRFFVVVGDAIGAERFGVEFGTTWQRTKGGSHGTQTGAATPGGADSPGDRGGVGSER